MADRTAIRRASVVGDRDDETILNENEMGVVINMRSVLKVLIIVTVGTAAFCLCLVYFGGIIEQVIEILLYLLCVAGLMVAFILGAQV